MRRLIQALALAALLVVGLPASAAGQIFVTSPPTAGAIGIDGVPVADQVAVWFDGNTLQGVSKLTEPTTGSLVLGTGAAAATMAGLNNTIIGQGAGAGVTSGIEQVLVGSSAGGNLTTGTRNVFIGFNAGANAIGGNQNVGVGRGAMASLTSGALNTAIGDFAGQGLTTGERNIAIGAGVTIGGNAQSRIAIGHFAVATADNQAVIGTAFAGSGITDMFLGSGVTKVSPSAFGLNVAGGSGMDNAAADWTFGGGRGTGSGAGGHLIFSTAPAGGSGSALNALVAALDIDDQQLLNVPVGIVLANEVEIFALDGGGSPDQIFKNDVTSTGQWSSSTLADNWNLDGAIQSGLNFAGPDGSKTEINTDRTVVNSATGATLTCSACIKAGTMVIGVSTFVRTSLGVTNGLVSYDIGLAADPDRWGAASGIVANDNSDGEDYTVLTTLIFTTDTDIILTGNGDGGDEFDGTGIITVVVHYWDMIAPSI